MMEIWVSSWYGGIRDILYISGVEPTYHGLALQVVVMLNICFAPQFPIMESQLPSMVRQVFRTSQKFNSSMRVA